MCDFLERVCLQHKRDEVCRHGDTTTGCGTTAKDIVGITNTTLVLGLLTKMTSTPR